MSQWKNKNEANNSVSWAAASLGVGSGNSNQASNNTNLFNNTTVNAFVSKQVIGQFGAQATANNSGENKKLAHKGWQLRRAGVGGAQTFGVSAAGSSGYANGETVVISGGQSNATAVITTTTLGNLASLAVVTPGLFSVNTGLTATFTRQKHVSSFLVSSAGTGYNNTDIVTVSNGTSNAVATIVTLGTGNISTITVNSGFVGLFGAAQTNTQTVTVITAANGAASNGTGAVVQANLTTSTGGSVSITALGGRAGRVHYECLVATGSLVTNTGSNTAQLPL